MNPTPSLHHRPLRRTLVLIVLLSAITIQATAQLYGSIDLGYSSRSFNAKPVFATAIGYRFAKAYNIAPIAEIGIRAHTDQAANNIAYGHLSAGIQYKEYIAITAGITAGGNQQKQDRHVTADTVILLRPGNKSEHWADYQLAIRFMNNLCKEEDGTPYLQLMY